MEDGNRKAGSKKSWCENRSDHPSIENEKVGSPNATRCKYVPRRARLSFENDHERVSAHEHSDSSSVFGRVKIGTSVSSHSKVVVAEGHLAVRLMAALALRA